MRIYTIGYSGKSAKVFFSRLKEAGVGKVIDIRRSNNTLYAGFTRSRDLPFLLQRICGIDYVHEPEFAPTLELLRGYQARLKQNKKDPEAWPEYVKRFRQEIKSRPILDLFRQHAAGAGDLCLLCMEATAERCHRSLLAEYISAHLKNELEIVHL